MKKLAAVVLVALVAALVWLFRSQEPAEEPAAGGAAKEAAESAEIVRERLEARARGEVDISPCSAAGRIVEAGSGRGIAGAVVLLRPRGLGKPIAPGETGAPITATTGDGGDWSVPMIAPGRYVMTASAPEYLPGSRTDLSLRAGGPNPGLDLALVRGGHPLRGTVSDVSGGPIEGAAITIDGEGDGNVIDFDRVSYPAFSDVEGKFVVQVPDGIYMVTAWHADYTDDNERVDMAGGPRSVALRLTPGATIEGTVKTTDGKPVEGAIVGDDDTMGLFSGQSALSDAQGRFRLANLSSGAHKLKAMAAGHASSEPVKVELGIGEALTGVEIRVERAFKISGFVVPRDEPKQALGGVMVGAYSLNPMSMYLSTGPSEVDGYFEVYGVKPGSYTLGSIAEDALPEILGGPSVTVEKADVTGVLVKLDRGVELRGRVEPATPASVSLALADDEPGFMSVIAGVGNMFVRSRADAKGEFRLRPVKPGKLRVIAEALDGSRGQVDVEVGARGLDGVVVALEPRATVQGRIVDAGGTPLQSGSVEFLARKRKDAGGFTFDMGGRGRGRAPIGEDGTYTVRGLDGGEYEVRVLDRAGNVIRWAGAEDRPYEPVRKDIAAAVATPGVDFKVELRDGVLRGVVLDPSGAPLADAWVTAAPERGSDAESRFHRPEADKPEERAGAVPEVPKEEEEEELGIEVDLGMGRGEPVLSGEDGRFEITGLARRTYTLSAEALKGSARVRMTKVALGSDVRLQVAPLAELSGTVRAADKPVTRYQMTVRRKSGGFGGQQENVDRADGTFHRDHLEPGQYVVIAWADAGRAEQEVEVKAGEHARVVVDLKPWAKLRGVLLDARGGQPLAGMTAVVRSSDGFEAAIFDTLLGKGPRTDATGRFEVTRIAPGKGTLELFDGDLMTQQEVAEVPFEVEAGVEKDLGTIYGVSVAKVPKAERGELGMKLLVATEARRPQAPGTKVEPLKEKEDPNAPKHLYVSAVTVGGPADKAGLQPGDELLAIEGSGVPGLGADNAQRLLQPGNVRRGQSVALEREREGSRETVTLEAIAQDKE